MPLKVVHVIWFDPCHAESGWMPKDDFIAWIKKGPSQADTVGLLVYESDEFIIVLQSIGNGVVADGVKITRSAIKSIKELAELPLTLDLEPDETS
jgi:hypothetical protein